MRGFDAPSREPYDNDDAVREAIVPPPERAGGSLQRCVSPTLEIEPGLTQLPLLARNAPCGYGTNPVNTVEVS
jgi:hypothetical protein